MTCVLVLAQNVDAGTVLGTRYSAIEFREQVERQLETCLSVQIDFGGIFVTQGFVDELLGPVILRMGSAALERLEFSNCNEDAKAIVRLVIGARLRDYSAGRDLLPKASHRDEKSWFPRFQVGVTIRQENNCPLHAPLERR